MDKTVKITKFLIGGFVALIIFGLFMPGSPSTASDSVKEEVKDTKSLDVQYMENNFFEYVKKFKQDDKYDFEKSKKNFLETGYYHCNSLNKDPLVKTDPYQIWTSIEISPLWFGIHSGAIMYLCPKSLEGLSKFTDTMGEASLDKYLVEAYPVDEMYTDADRAESKSLIMRNFAYVGGIK